MKFHWHVRRRNEYGQNLRGIGTFGLPTKTVSEALDEAFALIRNEVEIDAYLNRKGRIQIEIEIDTTE